MGSAQDIMQTFADKEIRAHFSSFDGWVCQKAQSPATRDTVFLITRNVRGKKETVGVELSFDEDPSATALLAVSAGYKGRQALKGLYLLTPQAADVSNVPDGIKVLSMNAFGFVDGRLIWLTKKKGAKHYVQPEVPAVSVAIPSVCQPHAA